MIQLFILLVFATYCRAAAPVIFFTDIEGGPNSGGENNDGAIATIYGTNFGTTGAGGCGTGTLSVTIGGGVAAAYYQSDGTRGGNCIRAHLWYQKFSVAVGASAATGEVVVTVSGQSSSGGPTFTVRSGTILFAATTGSDGNAGTFASPKGTIKGCTDTMVQAHGDICYLKTGLTRTADDNHSVLDLCLTNTSTTWSAVVAYPGATVTVGTGTKGTGIGMLKGLGSCPDTAYSVVAGLNLVAKAIAIDIEGNHIRIVGNTLDCHTVANGEQAGCFQSEVGGNNIAAFGNLVDNSAGTAGQGGKLYHGWYNGGDGHDFENGWNRIHDPAGCRGMMVNYTTDTYNISIHDNEIYNTSCDGLAITDADPQTGFIKVYNNLIHNVGQGPDLGTQSGACLQLESQSSHSGTIEVYNNTFAGCGKSSGCTWACGVIQRDANNAAIRFRNNIFIASSSSVPYFEGGTVTTGITGSNNVWFGNGNGPSETTGNVNSDPLFVNSASDWHLQSSSPAKDAGVNTGLSYDLDGNSRSGTFDIGAYELVSSTSSGGSSVIGNATMTGKAMRQ